MALRLDLDGRRRGTGASRNTNDARSSIRDLTLMLNVVVGEFPELRVIEADDFGILRRTERKAGDEVHDEKDDAGAEEAVCETGNTVRELVRELDVIAVQPAAADGGETVKMRDVVTVCIGKISEMISFVCCRTTYAANKPVNRLPTIPPIACTAKMSSVSSIRIRYLSFVAKLQAMAPTTPKMTADQAGTNPEAGVIATSPAMAPEQKPTVDHFLSSL